MQLVKNLIPEGSVCDTGKHFVDHKATNITIHYTGPLPKQTPEEVRKYWIDSKGEPSAHFIIKDDECLQCWEIDKIAWHTGTKAGNHCSIGIEVIPEDKQALKYIREANPDSIVKGFRMRDIAKEGGAIHCITWNIKK